MFTRLVVCSLILEALISKCHLEVVALSPTVYLESEEVMHVEGNKKRGGRPKKQFCSCFFGCCV